jgi:membrane protease YdiL (CAAX protease family)
MNNLLPLLPTFGLLALAICAVWVPPVPVGARTRMPLWIALFLASIISGVLAAFLTWQAVAGLAVYGATAYAAKTYSGNRALRVALLFITGAMALAMSMHKFPGFNNPLLAENMITSAGAPAFTHRASFDTISAGLILMALFGNPIQNLADWKLVLRRFAPIALMTIVTVLGLATAIGYVKFDFKTVPYTAVYLVANLLFTCVTEEAFFRGFMQGQLTQGMKSWRAGSYIAWIIAAVLFGIAHSKGGLTLIALATIAGLYYGYAFMSTKRVEASILTHIALNGVHFVAFTYPNLL